MALVALLGGPVQAWAEPALGQDGAALGDSVSATPDGELSQDPAGDARYRELIAKAVQEWDYGHWSEARALFEQAHELLPSARTLRAIGLTAFEDRHYVEAMLHLEASLLDPRRPLDAALRASVEGVLERARAYVARFQIALPLPAELMVDGAPAVLREEELLLDPGRHEVVATRQGYRSERRLVVATAGQSGRLSLELMPLSPAEQAPSSLAEPPPRADEAPARSGGAFSSYRWTWIAAGATLGAGAATLAFHLKARETVEDVRAECDRLPCTDEDVDALRESSHLGTWETARTVGLVTTGAAAAMLATGLVIELRRNSDRPRPVSAHLAPWFGAQLAGAHVSGRF